MAQLARIKELSGLSLRALARQAGLSSSSLSRYLTRPARAAVGGRRGAVPGRGPRPPATARGVGRGGQGRRGARPAPQRPAGRPVRLHRPGGGGRAGRRAAANRRRGRDRRHGGRRARPASPCTWPTGSRRRIRTAGSTSTCTASPRARSRWSRRPRWAGCWARWTSRILRPAPPNARRSGARSCPAGGRSSCSTTRSTRSRCARCFPARASPRCWSPAATGWSAWTGCRRCPWSHWPTTTRRTCSAGRPGSRSAGRRTRSARCCGSAAGSRWRCGWRARGFATAQAGRWRCWPSGCATAPAASTPCSACRSSSSTRTSAACSGCWACCRAPTSTRRWRARSPTCRPTGSTRCWRSWSTPTWSRSSRPGGTGCTT